MATWIFEKLRVDVRSRRSPALAHRIFHRRWDGAHTAIDGALRATRHACRSTLGKAAHAERYVEPERAGRYRRYVRARDIVTEAHQRTFAELFLDLADRQIQRFVFLFRRHLFYFLLLLTKKRIMFSQRWA
jgi:hypothetical protein